MKKKEIFTNKKVEFKYAVLIKKEEVLLFHNEKTARECLKRLQKEKNQFDKTQ